MNRPQNLAAALIALIASLSFFHRALMGPLVPDGLWPVIELHLASAFGFAGLTLAAVVADLALADPAVAEDFR